MIISFDVKSDADKIIIEFSPAIFGTKRSRYSGIVVEKKNNSDLISDIQDFMIEMLRKKGVV